MVSTDQTVGLCNMFVHTSNDLSLDAIYGSIHPVIERFKAAVQLRHVRSTTLFDRSSDTVDCL